MRVSVVIPTRGDQDLTSIVASYDGIADEVLVWDNSQREDLAVYGRYAMIEEARNEVILTQDDDVIVADPAALVRSYETRLTTALVVCNMPPDFRHEFYEEHALVGFGAVFRRSAPRRAFDRFWSTYPREAVGEDLFYRTCDIVFTGLTNRVLVDVPYKNLPWAYQETRLWKQLGHQADRVRMLELVRAIV